MTVVQDLVSPDILEAKASSEALSLSMDLLCNNVIIATDCQGTENNLQGDYLGISAAIIHEIKQKMKSVGSVYFVYESRSLSRSS